MWGSPYGEGRIIQELLDGLGVAHLEEPLLQQLEPQLLVLR